MSAESARKNGRSGLFVAFFVVGLFLVVYGWAGEIYPYYWDPARENWVDKDEVLGGFTFTVPGILFVMAAAVVGRRSWILMLLCTFPLLLATLRLIALVKAL